MNTENRPRGVLVTGGGRGIGRAIAHRFARAGFAVAVNDVDAVAAETVAREVRDAGAEAIAVPADVADPRAAHTLVTQTVSRMGRLDALVNNAGIEHRASLDRHTATEWRRVLDVNLTAPFELARMAAPHLAAGGSGAIVNVCSVAVTGFSGQIAYDASKGGLLTLTRSLAVELGRRGIRANAVCPGFIRTDMTAHGDLALLGERQVAKLPLPRFGEADEVAHAVAWLASDEAGYITGQALFIDGGMVRA